MDQDLHITKKENWFDTDPQRDISMDEWIAYVKMDPEMRLDNFSEVALPSGETYKYNNPGATVWMHHSAERILVKTSFDFLSGNVTVKNPYPAAIEKMRHIAFKLGAKLQSDEGKCFAGLVDYTVAENAESIAMQEKAGTVKKILWKLQHNLFISAFRK